MHHSKNEKWLKSRCRYSKLSTYPGLPSPRPMPDGQLILKLCVCRAIPYNGDKQILKPNALA